MKYSRNQKKHLSFLRCGFIFLARQFVYRVFMTTDTKQLFVTCQFCIVIKGNAAEDGFLLPSCWAKKQTNTWVSCLKRLLPHLPLRGPIMICMSSVKIY